MQAGSCSMVQRDPRCPWNRGLKWAACRQTQSQTQFQSQQRNQTRNHLRNLAWSRVLRAAFGAPRHWHRCAPRPRSGWMDGRQRPRSATRRASWLLPVLLQRSWVQPEPPRPVRPTTTQAPEQPPTRIRPALSPLGQRLERRAKPGPQPAWARRVRPMWARGHRPPPHRPSSSWATSPSWRASSPRPHRPFRRSRRPCRRQRRRTTLEWSARGQPTPSTQRSRRPRSAHAGTSRRRPCW